MWNNHTLIANDRHTLPWSKIESNKSNRRNSSPTLYMYWYNNVVNVFSFWWSNDIMTMTCTNAQDLWYAGNHVKCHFCWALACRDVMSSVNFIQWFTKTTTTKLGPLKQAFFQDSGDTHNCISIYLRILERVNRYGVRRETPCTGTS